MFENGDLILRYLERLGVEYVFGVPGEYRAVLQRASS